MTKDQFGPELIFELYDPIIGMEGYLVIDNTALGVGKGGIRFTPDVSVEEVGRLARTMTWKNALFELDFGGAKGGIKWPGGDEKKKKALVESYARAIKPYLVTRYIAGPDVASGEAEMKWLAEAAGDWQASTGKPKDYCQDGHCGLPHELGSTGFGVAVATIAAIESLGLKVAETTVAIEGFGNVGTFAFKHLVEAGAKIIAVADSKGTAFNQDGLSYDDLVSAKKTQGSVSFCTGAKALSHDDIFALAVDVLIPAATTDVIHASNKDQIKAKILVEGSNIPMIESIEQELAKRMLIVPDFVANGGGVISSYAEHHGQSPEAMFALVKSKIDKTTRLVLARAKKENQPLRAVALKIAQERVEAAMSARSSAFAD